MPQKTKPRKAATQAAKKEKAPTSKSNSTKVKRTAAHKIAPNPVITRQTVTQELPSLWAKTRLWAGIVFVVYLLLSLWGMPTTNVGYADSDELITLASQWGIAHPPGLPAYMTLLHFFQALPLPISLAARSHVLHILLTTSTVVFIFLASHSLYALNAKKSKSSVGFSPAFERWFLSLITASTFGLSYLVLLYSHVTEKYAFGMALLAFIAWWLLAHYQAESKRFQKAWFVALLACGLLISHLPLAALVLPALAYYAWDRRQLLSPQSLGISLVIGLIGFALPLGLLPLMKQQAALSWGFEPNLQGVVHQLTQPHFAAELYPSQPQVGAYLAEINFAQSIRALAEYAQHSLSYWGWWFVVVVALVVVVLRQKPHPSLTFLLLGYLGIGLGLVAYLKYPTDLGSQALLQRHYLLGYVFLGLVSWFGWYQVWRRLYHFNAALTKKKVATALTVGVLSLVVIGQGLHNLADANLRQVRFISDTYIQALAAAQPEAVVVCFSDVSCSALLYEHFALGNRPDITLVPLDYSLVEQLYQDKNLMGFNYQTNPFQLWDIVSWNLAQGRPIQAVDLDQYYYSFLGIEQGTIFYNPSSLFGTIDTSVATSLPEQPTQLLAQLDTVKLPQRDLMRRWLHLHSANHMIMNSVSHLRSGERQAARDVLTDAASIYYRHGEKEQAEITTLRSNLEQLMEEPNMLPGSHSQTVTEYFDHLQPLLEAEQFGKALLTVKAILTLEPTNIEARLILADLYAQGEAVDFSLREYEHVLLLDPDNQTALAKLEAIRTN